MICPKCGSQIDDDSVFCPNCGSAIVKDTEEFQKTADMTQSPEGVPADEPVFSGTQEQTANENTFENVQQPSANGTAFENVQQPSADETAQGNMYEQSTGATVSPGEQEPVEEVESEPVVEPASGGFNGGFQNIPPVEGEPKKKFPLIPIIALAVVIAVAALLFVCCGNSNKSIIKKTIKAIQNEDGEAYADLLSEEQIKKMLKNEDKFDYKDDEDVADYCKDNFCKDKFKDDEFSYKILDENDATKDEIKDFNRNNKFYEIKSMTSYLVKITYDDEDDGYAYIQIVIAKDKEQGRILLSDGFSTTLQTLGSDYSMSNESDDAN